MTEEERRDLALMKYAAIVPMVTGKTSAENVTAFCREAAKQEFTLPNGSRRIYAPKTIECWYRDYLKGGFDALLPSGRKDEGVSRALDEELKEKILYLKKAYPRLPCTMIHRKLLEDGDMKPEEAVSLSTITRFVDRYMKESKSTTNLDLHRYERPHINEVWCGDSSVGPKLKGKRIYCIALMDDASRLITGIGLFYNDNFANLMTVIKSAVRKYGRPAVFNFDNGATYRNKQMELLAARIGTAINYCQPYTPIQKAKIERWFLTMKEQWMAGINMKDFDSLEDLNTSLLSYVDRYNKAPHTSLGDMSPEERYFSEPERIRRLTEEQIEKGFLLELERRVSTDNVISIDNVEYEVPIRFSRQRIRLRFTPDMETIYVTEADGTLTPIKLLNKAENALMKRESIRFSGGEE